VREARRVAIRKLARRQRERHLLLFPVVLGLCLAWVDTAGAGDSSARSMGDACWAFSMNALVVLWWVAVKPRRKGAVDWIAQLFVIPVLLVVVGWILAWQPNPQMLDGSVLSNVAICSGVVLPTCWAFSGRYGTWRLLFGAGLVTLLALASIHCLELFNTANGSEWSIVDDPRSGQPFDQYPLRHDEVGFLTVPGMALGVLMMLASLLLRRSLGRI